MVSHCRFENNHAFGAFLSAGGAILIEGKMIVMHSQFKDNTAQTLFGGGSLDPIQGAGVGGAILVGPASDVSISHTHFKGNVASGGNGLVLVGVANGNGGLAGGGAILAIPFSLTAAGPSTLSVDRSTFQNNHAIAGAGVDGGAGGEASGGAIESTFGITASVARSVFINNEAIGGAGGNDADGRPGGAGGLAWGGAYANTGGTLTVDRSAFHGNRAAGGAGADGGAGGIAHGGAVASSNNTLLAPDSRPTTNIQRSAFSDNTAQGGAGGSGWAGASGGNGGDGLGGAIDHQFGTMTVSGSILVANWATGGRGGAGGAGGTGGNGGNGLGGGFANDVGGTLTVSSTIVVANRATGGAGAAGGNGGHGQGGGLWNGTDSTLELTQKLDIWESGQARRRRCRRRTRRWDGRRSLQPGRHRHRCPHAHLRQRRRSV